MVPSGFRYYSTSYHLCGGYALAVDIDTCTYYNDCNDYYAFYAGVSADFLRRYDTASGGGENTDGSHGSLSRL